jgi:hypothetical protein
MKNKKILIVSHQFLPHVSPRTTRWSLIIDYLVAQGNEVTVVSGTKPEQSEKNYKVIYYGNKNLSKVMNTARKNSNDSSSSKSKKMSYKVIKVLYRFIFRTFAWPDYAMFWIFTINKNKKKIYDNYDIIISISLPFTSHVCAYLLNRKIKADWFMDIGDPFSLKEFSNENNKFIFSYLNRYIEKKYYRIASKIIFTHKEASELHIDKFKIQTSKIINGYPVGKIDNNIILESKKFNYSQNPIKIGFFGIFTAGVRDPSNYLQFISNNYAFEHEHHWYINQESKKFLNKLDKTQIHNIHDIVPRETALEVMVKEMHFLLSIGNFNKYQLPSKVIEYISLGKPVLHFAEINDDPLYEFEHSFKNFKIINMNTTRQQIEDFLKVFITGEFNFDFQTFEKKFTSKAIVDDLS